MIKSWFYRWTHFPGSQLTKTMGLHIYLFTETHETSCIHVHGSPWEHVNLCTEVLETSCNYTCSWMSKRHVYPSTEFHDSMYTRVHEGPWQHVYLRMKVHESMYESMYTCAWMSTRRHAYLSVEVHESVYTCAWMSIGACIPVHKCPREHVYLCTDVHDSMHTCAQRSMRAFIPVHGCPREYAYLCMDVSRIPMNRSPWEFTHTCRQTSTRVHDTFRTVVLESSWYLRAEIHESSCIPVHRGPWEVVPYLRTPASRHLDHSSPTTWWVGTCCRLSRTWWCQSQSEDNRGYSSACRLPRTRSRPGKSRPWRCLSCLLARGQALDKQQLAWNKNVLMVYCPIELDSSNYTGKSLR